MTIQHVTTEYTYSLSEIKEIWKAEEHDNFSGAFLEYLLNVIGSTQAAQNDCKVLYMTKAELDKFVWRILDKLSDMD